jgi:RNA 2',3'-cyclic 3'-phosphodiesterase
MIDRSATGSGRLFLAVLPDSDASARIHRLARVLKRAHRFSGRLIHPTHLHVSLFFLGAPSEYVAEVVSEAAAEVRTQPFEIWFDRSASFQGRSGNWPFVLVGDDGVRGLLTLRRALGAALASRGMKQLAKREFTPHVTILYAERQVEEYPIEPIRWVVSEFVLIHSKNGHRHLARWPLYA